MRVLLTITTFILLMAFTLTAGCSKGGSPVSPDSTPLDDVSQAQLADSQGDQFLLWMYDVTIDPVTLDYTMDPIVSRNSAAIGDSFEVEVSPYMTGWFLGIKCADCLQIQKIGLYGNNDILLDVFMKHPFDSSWRVKRTDLDVFDPRLILINEGTDTRFTRTNGIGATDDPIMGNFNFLKNADGYTSHFDNRAELPEFIGTPKNYDGNLNPFKYFFVDTDPDPLIYAKENTNHRMPMGNTYDVQRLRLASPGAGNTLEFVMAVEISYVASSNMYTRLTPKYHLPEGNQKEACNVQTNLSRTLVAWDGTPPQPSDLDFHVYVQDWQNATPIGPLDTQVRQMSNVANVTVEIPGISTVLGSENIPLGGNGLLYDPYDYNITMPYDEIAPEGQYLALVAVEDQMNDTPRADVYYNYKQLDDFVAYKIYPINVIATGTVPLITIYNYSLSYSAGTCTVSGEIQYLDQTSAPQLTHGKFGDPGSYRSYPLNVDFDGTFTTKVVLFVGANEISFDASNTFGPAITQILPLINYSPNPLPKFRATLYWTPTVPDLLDSTDMDLHLWNVASEHCSYIQRNIGDPSYGEIFLNIDDPDGYGPENMDGLGGTANWTSGYYPLAVNYFSNHRGLTAHAINCTVRLLLNPGTANEVTEEYTFSLNEENGNSFLSYPITDNTNSWYRVRDLGIDPLGVVSTYPPDTLHPLDY